MISGTKLCETAHCQAFYDSEPILQLKEAKLYDSVWQTSDVVGCLMKVTGQAAPKGIFRPPYGKTRLPGMPQELPSFSWEQVFKYGVTELELLSSSERRVRIEGFLERLREIVREGESLTKPRVQQSQGSYSGTREIPTTIRAQPLLVMAPRPFLIPLSLIYCSDDVVDPLEPGNRPTEHEGYQLVRACLRRQAARRVAEWFYASSPGLVLCLWSPFKML